MTLVPVAAQNSADNVFAIGMKFHEAGLGNQAMLEFKRYVFFQTRLGQPIQTAVYFHIAEIYYGETEYEKALKYFREYQNVTSEFIQADYEFELNLLEKLGFNNLGRIRLYGLALNPPPFPEIQRLTILKNLTVAARLHEWKNLRFFFLLSEKEKIFDIADSKDLDSLILQGENFKPLSPGLAVFFSSVIPGSGQMYAGFPGQGLNAFLLNGSLVGLSVFSISSGAVGDFALLEFPNLFRFYRGNIINTRNLADKRNILKEQEISAKIMKILEQYAL